MQIDDYPDLLSKCGIDVNHTNEGVALPVCVPHLVPTLLLTNYTRTSYARFINASRFSGAGLGHEDDWMVVVLTTSTPRGDFAGATSLVSTFQGRSRPLLGDFVARSSCLSTVLNSANHGTPCCFFY